LRSSINSGHTPWPEDFTRHPPREGDDPMTFDSVVSHLVAPQVRMLDLLITMAARQLTATTP
jgi:hypothetical protein